MQRHPTGSVGINLSDISRAASSALPQPYPRVDSQGEILSADALKQRGMHAAQYHKTSIEAMLHSRHAGATPYRTVLGDVSALHLYAAACLSAMLFRHSLCSVVQGVSLLALMLHTTAHLQLLQLLSLHLCGQKHSVALLLLTKVKPPQVSQTLTTLKQHAFLPHAICAARG